MHAENRGNATGSLRWINDRFLPNLGERAASRAAALLRSRNLRCLFFAQVNRFLGSSLDCILG
jgi:hypothetical protein